MNQKKLILIVVGARPNFVKAAPLLKSLKGNDHFSYKLIHTGQHYDKMMSNIFFEDLNIQRPDYNLNINGGTQNTQIANIMISFEKICVQKQPDLIFVFGDVNSTLAASITAKKMNIKLVHYEAGLRSFDKSMPEEINRLACDSIADYFLCTEENAIENLLNEGKNRESIFLVGNLMIDSVFNQINKNYLKYDLEEEYAVLTMHRPSNVDDSKNLKKLLAIFNLISNKIKIIFPVHPRTKKKLSSFSINKNISLIDPLGYSEFIKLWANSKFVITDSGGIQEETTALKIPCLTIRENTERPITVDVGSNIIVGSNEKIILKTVDDILKNQYKKSSVPKYWDGKTSSRISKILKEIL